MKILHIAPLIEPLASSAPGGSEQIAVSLAATQARLGHEVAMIACEGSVLPPQITQIHAGIQVGSLVPIDTSKVTQREAEELHADRKDREFRVYSALITKLSSLGGEHFDIVHNHAFDEALLFPDRRLGRHVIHTLHCPPLVPWLVERLRTLLQSHRSRYVTVSHACAKDWHAASGVAPQVVYNGLELEDIPFAADPAHHFAWVGRISPEKGLHTALRIAKQLQLTELKVFGRVYDSTYFEREIREALSDPHVSYYGFQPRSTIFPLIAKARAVISPIEWEEPFGLVFIESLAAGTPVVAFRRGAAAEIIEHGQTGFLVDNAEEMCEAIGRVDRLSRQRCRASVMSRFDVATMARNYLRVYTEQLATNPD